MGCILFSSWGDTSSVQQPAVEETRSETQEQYRQALQTQLTDILERIDGVGNADVLVTIAGSEAYHYAQEGDSTMSDAQVKTSHSYVTIGSGSSQQALIESVAHPTITGVVVVCEGGDRSTVQESVYHAVSVVCGISTAQIYVTKGATP